MTVQAASPLDLHPVDLFSCRGGEAERSLRKRLHRARDVAGRSAWHQDQDSGSREIYRLAHEAADAWVFRPAGMVQLQDAIHCITRLFQAATIAERLERGQ